MPEEAEQTAPAKAPAPAPAPAKAPDPVLASGLTASEESTLAGLQDKAQAAAAAGPTVEVRIEEPHTEMVYGARRITGAWTPVPETEIGPLMEAAANGGVTLTQKES
jgi:hypothetical protein